MSDLFSLYEDSLNVVLRRISSVSETLNNLSKEKKESALVDAENSIKEAERIVKQMDLEISVDKISKGSDRLLQRLSNYKSEVEAAKRRFQKLKEDYINKKSLDALIMDNYETGGQQNNKSKKDILIENEHAAWDQNFQLENAKRVAFDIEHVGGEVMRSMHEQTSQIKNIKGRVIQLDENIDQGDYYINNMYSTQRKKRLAIIAFGIVFAIIFIVIMIFKFMK